MYFMRCDWYDDGNKKKAGRKSDVWWVWNFSFCIHENVTLETELEQDASVVIISGIRHDDMAAYAIDG